MGAILNDGRDPKSPHMPTTEALLHRRSPEGAVRESDTTDSSVSAYSSRHTHAGDYRLPYAPEFFRSYPHLREFFCGGTAAAINIVITFPPNKIMFRQQVRLDMTVRLLLWRWLKLWSCVLCVWVSFVCSSSA